MAIECPRCKHKFVKKPYKNNDGSWNWKNILIPDYDVVIQLAIILMLMFAWSYDMDNCREVLEIPCEYCDQIGCNPEENIYEYGGFINFSSQGLSHHDSEHVELSYQ